MQGNSVKKNFALNAILTVSGILFPLLSFPYVSRVLGPEGTGRVDFATSFISYFVLLANLGIPSYGIRACARVRDNKLALSRTVHELIVIHGIMSLLALFVYIPCIMFIPKLNNDVILYTTMSLVLLSNPFNIEYLYSGLEQYSYITKRSLLVRLLAFIALFVFIRNKTHYIVYGAILTLSNVIPSFFNIIYSTKLITHRKLGKCNYSRHFKPIAIFFAMSCAVSLYVSLDKLMLGFMTSESDVGFYGAAVKMKSMLVVLVTSLGSVLLPRASYYVERGEFDAFERITEKALKFVMISATPVSLFFLLFAKDSIIFLAGIDYLDSIPAMMIIMPSVLFIGVSGLVGLQVLVPMGKERYVLYSEIAGAATDFLLNLILIPKYRATGAAIGTLIAEFVVLLVQLILMLRIKKNNPLLHSFRTVKYWKILCGCIPAAILAGGMYWILKEQNLDGCLIVGLQLDALMISSIIRLSILAVLFFGCYVFVMTALKDDMMMEILKTVIGKLRKKKAAA